MKKRLLPVELNKTPLFRQSTKRCRVKMLSFILVSGFLPMAPVFASSFSDHVAAQVSDIKQFFSKAPSSSQTAASSPSVNTANSPAVTPAQPSAKPQATSSIPVGRRQIVQPKKGAIQQKAATTGSMVISPKFVPKTELSKKTLKLRIGMTREEVLKILGTPTWGQSYAGMPLDWTWKNGSCNPVDVTFDESLHVNGFNEGRASCLETEYQDVPDDQYLCANPDVQVLCGVTFKYHPLKNLGEKEKSHHIFVMANRDRKNT